MGKRFTDTEKWNDEWFRSLKPTYKCLWMYLCDRCDMSGVWKIDRGLVDFQIGESIDWDTVFDSFGKRLVLIKEDRIFVVTFIDFQYGQLNELSRPHQAVLKTLEFHNIVYPIDTLSIPYTKSIDTLKDKDKDKDKDKNKEKEEEEDHKGKPLTADETTFEQFRKSYPGSKKGLQTEYQNFVKKYKDHKLIISTLQTSLENQIQWKIEMSAAGMFVPSWKNLQTWINQKCWEEEKPVIEIKQPIKNQYGPKPLTQDVFEDQMRMKLE